MDINGKIILVSNRDVFPKETTVKLFGDNLNTKGAEQLNFALAESVNSKWQLELLSNPSKPSYNKPKSFEVFKKCLTLDNGKDWVLFVHGYNQSLEKNLNKCQEIADYGFNVIAFSWPSNPGPQGILKKLKEYKRALKNAKRSAIALERMMEVMNRYITQYQSSECKLNINMVIHSLGNFVFEEVVRSSTYENECNIFTNVILHQADVNARGHEDWVEKLTDHTKVYITQNDKDGVLAASDAVNANRLGNSSDYCVMDTVKYFNFTDAKHVYIDHRPWHQATKNKGVVDFYNSVFSGKRPELLSTWSYNENRNFYYIK